LLQAALFSNPMSLSSPLVKLIAGYLFHLNSPDIIEEINDEKITNNKVFYYLSNDIYLSDELEKYVITTYVRENAYEILTSLSLIYHPDDKKLLQKLNCPGSIDQQVMDRTHKRDYIEFNLVDVIVIWAVMHRNMPCILNFLEDFISCFGIITATYSRTTYNGVRRPHAMYNIAACTDIAEYLALMDDAEAYKYVIDHFKIPKVHNYISSAVTCRRYLPNMQKYFDSISYKE
jgi:hypothetical protein